MNCTIVFFSLSHNCPWLRVSLLHLRLFTLCTPMVVEGLEIVPIGDNTSGSMVVEVLLYMEIVATLVVAMHQIKGMAIITTTIIGGPHRGLSVASGLLRSSPNSRGSCWICLQQGHLATNCPQTLRPDNELSRAFAGMHLAQPLMRLGFRTRVQRNTWMLVPWLVPLGMVPRIKLWLVMVKLPHNGNLSFASGSFNFHLSNVLQVPGTCKSLWSIAKFTRDNLVSLTFFFCPWGFVIRDLKTRVVLFSGPHARMDSI